MAKTLRVAAALLMAGIVGLAGCSERRAESFRRQGDALYGLERYDEAIAYYGRAAELNPQDARVRSALGRCYAAKGQHAAAAEQFETAVSLDKTAQAVHAKNVAILRDAGQAEAAEKLARMLGAGMAPGPEAAVGGAQADDWRSLWGRAALHELLERRSSFAEEDGLAETLFVAALLTGNGAAVEELGGALEAGSPLRAYHDALLRGDVREALAAVSNQADAAGPTASLREYALGYALALGGARSRAVQTYSTALKTWPEQHAGFYAIAQVFSISGMPKVAARCLQNLLAGDGENLAARMLLYEMLKQAGLSAEARRTAEALHRLAPEFSGSALALGEAYLESNEGELALSVLRQGLAANPGENRLRLALAYALLRLDRAAEALDQLKGVEGAQAARLSAFAHARLGQWAEAEARARETDASDEATALLRAAAAAHQGRAADARELLNAANAAVLIEADRDLQSLCAGWAYFRAGLYGAALETLEPALESGRPDGVMEAVFVCIARGVAEDERVARAKLLAERYAGAEGAWLGLSSVLESAGDADGAREAVEKAVSVAPDSQAVLKARGAFFERSGDFEQAVAAYRRLAELAPDDPGTGNNLAYLLLITGGDAQEALGFAERAASSAGMDAGVVHTLGLAQFRAGKLEESQATLRRALELRPLEPTLLLDYGQALIAAGDEKEGAVQVGLAVRLSEQLGLEFPRRAEAEKLLGSTQAP